MVDFKKIDELLATNVTLPQMDSLPNTIIVQEEFKDDTPAEILRLQRTVVTELNAFYLFNGKYQGLKALKEKVPDILTLTPVGLKDLFKRVNSTLDKRGLPPFQLNFKSVQPEYDPEFIGACSTLADFTDKRPMAAKLKEIGVSTKKWNMWLRSKSNYDYWHRLVDSLMDREVFEEGRMALAQNVSRGDLASFKYFNELTDKFVSQKEFDPRIIGVLMSGVLDIIMRHVEGTVASAIAEEIQQLGISSLVGAAPVGPQMKVIDLE